MSYKLRTSPELPWRTWLSLSALSFVLNVTRRPNHTVNRCLFNLLDIKASPSKTPVKGVTTSDIIVDASRNLWFRLFTPISGAGEEASMPVIVYFHGGGFEFMAANSKRYDDICRGLARELHAVIVSVNYRLAPEHRYPCAYEDGVDVLNFLDNTNIESFPPCANLKHCFFAGDSAGGNLAHHLAVRANEISLSKLKLIGLIAIQPFFGGEERTESEINLVNPPFLSLELADWMWKAFLPEGSDRDHPAANVFGPNSVDISGINFPPTLLFVGGFDILQDWQKRYYEGLKRRGKEAYLIEYPNAFHFFYAFTELPEYSLFVNEVRDFMRSQAAK